MSRQVIVHDAARFDGVNAASILYGDGYGRWQAFVLVSLIEIILDKLRL